MLHITGMDLLRMSRRATVSAGIMTLALLAALVGWTLRRPRGPEPTDRPVPRLRDYPWMSLTTWRDRHEALVRIDPEAKQRAKLVFLGDSIVQGWDDRAFAQWFSSDQALRLGIGGDKTQNLLWRILNGELDGFRPRVVVVLIGTNNIGHDQAAPADVAKGIAAIAGTVESKLPQASVLLLGILPCNELPRAPARLVILETNQLVAKLADRRKVWFLDVGQHFLAPDGKIPQDLMADFLHPTAKGYRVLGEAIGPTIREMMGAGPAPTP